MFPSEHSLHCAHEDIVRDLHHLLNVHNAMHTNTPLDFIDRNFKQICLQGQIPARVPVLGHPIYLPPQKVLVQNPPIYRSKVLLESKPEIIIQNQLAFRPIIKQRYNEMTSSVPIITNQNQYISYPTIVSTEPTEYIPVADSKIYRIVKNPSANRIEEHCFDENPVFEKKFIKKNTKKPKFIKEVIYYSQYPEDEIDEEEPVLIKRKYHRRKAYPRNNHMSIKNKGNFNIEKKYSNYNYSPKCYEVEREESLPDDFSDEEIEISQPRDQPALNKIDPSYSQYVKSQYLSYNFRLKNEANKELNTPEGKKHSNIELSPKTNIEEVQTNAPNTENKPILKQS